MAADGPIVEDLWFAEDATDGADDAASQSFAAKVAELGRLRPFTATAQRIIELLSDPDFRIRDVRVAIEEDPALAARILRVANSAAFAGSRPVDSVQRAVIRLGSGTVRDLLVALTTMDMFQDVTGTGRVVRDHSASTGALSRVIARDFVDEALPGMFLIGLLHDVGKLLLLQSGEFPTKALTLQELEDLENPDASHLIERRFLGYDHAVLGGHAVLLWRIPFPAPQVIAWHHQPQRAIEAGDELIERMVTVLRVADRVDRLLLSDPPDDKRQLKAFVKRPECRRLGITVPSLLTIWSELFLLKAETSALFQ